MALSSGKQQNPPTELALLYESANPVSTIGNVASATTVTRNEESFRIYVEIGGEPDGPKATKRMPLSDFRPGAKITNNNPPVPARATSTEATAKHRAPWRSAVSQGEGLDQGEESQGSGS
jgi:hypothetical protein